MGKVTLWAKCDIMGKMRAPLALTFSHNVFTLWVKMTLWAKCEDIMGKM